MVSTFMDSGKFLEDFAETMYVCCPKCQKRASVTRIPADEEKIKTDISRRFSWWRMKGFAATAGRYPRSFSPRKLSCLHCGYVKTWKGNARDAKGPCDWYFGLPLWLQTVCCGNILWAFNEEHLNFLEQYVAATHRVKYHVNGQMRNNTMASRLPLWVKSAKNRQQVLKGIARLRSMLENP
jgi:hypothetical protein